MSFQHLNKPELLKAAELFEVPVTEDDTKAQILAAFEEKEVSWKNYKKFVEDQKEESDPEDSEEYLFEEDRPGYNDEEERWYDNGGSLPRAELYTNESEEEVSFEEKYVLIKMERGNPTYEILGERFTRAQPFRVVTEEQAQRIFDAAALEGGGFRIATPAEAKSFFG
jgi:hypothetical protein